MEAGGGIDGGSISFTRAGGDSFITEAFSAVTGTPMTISTWLKTTSTEKLGVAYLGNGAISNQYYVLGSRAGNARLAARNPAEIEIAGTLVVNDGEWHHVLAVFSSPTERQLYVDGMFEGSSTVEVPEVSLNRFGIGGLTRNTPYNPSDLFNGQVDDVAIWDRALTETDAAALNGLGILGGGNASDSDRLVDGFNSQSSAVVRGKDWQYATGLAGGIGTTGGKVVSRTAFIVLDDQGNGMRMRALDGFPVINRYTGTPLVIFLGETATLDWSVENATGISINGGVGVVTNPAGSVNVMPNATTTYSLSATNAKGTSVGEVTITVISEPVIDGFGADRTRVAEGEPVRLSWSVRNFTSLTIDQGVGAITGTSGFMTVNPSATTTYTLTATNATTTSTAKVLVTVGSTPPPTPSDFLISSIVRDTTGTTLSWKSSPEKTYGIQFSSDLVDWSVEVGSNILSQGTTTTFTDTDAGRLGQPVGFYRLVR